MTKNTAILLLTLLFCCVSCGQDIPRVHVFNHSCAGPMDSASWTYHCKDVKLIQHIPYPYSNVCVLSVCGVQHTYDVKTGCHDFVEERK
jgi:hypothetical protein